MMEWGCLFHQNSPNLLDKFEDKMLDEFPKMLPPRCTIDHQIELESGLQPPARAPYQLSGPELEELKRQLMELIDAGFIRPSRSPYGAPSSFKRRRTQQN
jgi:hypothetical protein